MITAAALAIAGAGAVLAGRPRGVAHVVRSPVRTPSGRWVRTRPVCRRRLKRLGVLERDDAAWGESTRRLCYSCVSRLAGPVTDAVTPAFVAGRRPEQMPDLEALVGALTFVTTHEELHAATACLVAGVAGHSLGDLLGARPLPFRGGKVRPVALLALAKHQNPDAACCPVVESLGPYGGPIGTIVEDRRAQRERLGLTRRTVRRYV